VDSEATTSGGKPLPLILARELASNLATPMMLFDDRGMLVFYNDAAAQLIGKPFAEMGETPGEEFGAAIRMKTPDGKVLRRRDSPSVISLMERRPSHQTLYATGYDGVERLVHSTAYPLFGTNGEMHGVVSVFWEVGDGEETS
jgi:PAS domain-containing protein